MNKYNSMCVQWRLLRIPNLINCLICLFISARVQGSKAEVSVEEVCINLIHNINCKPIFKSKVRGSVTVAFHANIYIFVVLFVCLS